MKISYANALAGICERVPNADIDVITHAIGSDSRIGNKCLRAGLGFGGPCFPRDNNAFQSFAKEYGADALLGKAVVAINDSIPQRLFSRVAEHCVTPAKVALLGLSYKADTHIIEESHSVKLAQLLSAAGYQVSAYDPKSVDFIEKLHGKISVVNDPYDCVSGSSAILLLTDWPEFHDLNWKRIATMTSPGSLVLDSWRIAKHGDMSAFTYIPIGIGISNKD